MTYRELQAALKTYKSNLAFTVNCKLNAKREVLQAEYDRIQGLIQKWESARSAKPKTQVLVAPKGARSAKPKGARSAKPKGARSAKPKTQVLVAPKGYSFADDQVLPEEAIIIDGIAYC